MVSQNSRDPTATVSTNSPVKSSASSHIPPAHSMAETSDIRLRKPVGGFIYTSQLTQQSSQDNPPSYIYADEDKYNKLPPKERQTDWIDSLYSDVFRYDAKTVTIALVLTVLSLATRFWNIEKGNFVIWDEAHFGKFASYYLKRKFYFDVHPPLGKMLVALAGLVAGYRGDFEFESGAWYPDNLNYAVMRIFLSCFGAFMVPLAFLTCLEMKFSRRGAIVAALMVMFDNAYLSISRYILLDSMLLFFTVLTFYCLTAFINLKSKPFSIGWWFWLIATGVSIGCVSSVKWVGFFVTALVGLYTIQDLWEKYGDLSLPFVTFLKHFGARVIGLIIVPILIYMLTFYIHFAILINSGSGDAQMSSLFQAQLVGNNFHESPVFIAFNSKVSIKNNGYNGGLLHSHVQTYPQGSKQQQITCYHHRDDNNNWNIRKIRGETYSNDPNEIEYVKDGDIVRLIHTQTGRNLHSHPILGPVTKWGYEVSAYGNETIGDSNDHWRVEIVHDYQADGTDRVRALTTVFRLRHVNLRCLLRSHNVNLPEWGFKQAEVICDKQNRTDSHNLWNIEQHWNDIMPKGNPEFYHSNFINDFIHLNVGMWFSNNALIPDPDKEDLLASLPRQWPFLSVGLRMCGWNDNAYKVYLLGNPIVWWSGTASLILFGLAYIFHSLRFRRGINNWKQGEWQSFVDKGKLLLFGWVLHYIPFMIMGRVTYLHHYFPALYFSILMAAFMADHISSYLPNVVNKLPHLILLGVVGVVFFVFAPISYGFSEPSSDYRHLKWLDSWTMVND